LSGVQPVIAQIPPVDLAVVVVEHAELVGAQGVDGAKCHPRRVGEGDAQGAETTLVGVVVTTPGAGEPEAADNPPGAVVEAVT